MYYPGYHFTFTVAEENLLLPVFLMNLEKKSRRSEKVFLFFISHRAVLFIGNFLEQAAAT